MNARVFRSRFLLSAVLLFTLSQAAAANTGALRVEVLEQTKGRLISADLTLKTMDGKVINTLYAAAGRVQWNSAPAGMLKIEALTRAGNLVGETTMMIKANTINRAIITVAPAQIKWETNTDRMGMNLPPTKFTINKDVEAFVAVQQCEDACENNPQCRAFTYVRPGVQGPHGVCYLKGGIPPATANPCCTSGVVR